jgi:GntR family transcriptional repressor for pyruvate dehydrogenase complex
LEVYSAAAIEFSKTRDPDQFKEVVDLDLKFHTQICKMSHNTLYIYSFAAAKVLIHQYLNIIIKQRTDQFAKAERDGKSAFLSKTELHFVILDSIREKEFERGKRAYLDMVDYRVDL